MATSPLLRSQPTRDRILAAARRAFAAEGFERATVRAIAADAGCNPSLVIRYYRSKEALFAAALAFDLELPDLTGVARGKVGARLAAHFLERWERQLANNELVALLRAGVNHEGARRRMVAIFETQLCVAVERVAGPETAPSRAALIASHLLGLGLTRYVLKFPAAVDLSRETIVATVGRTIQAYLTGPLPGAGVLNLLLIKALTEAHPYNRFVEALDAGLRELGHAPTVSDQSRFVVNGAAPADDLMRELQAARYDAVLSFNSFFGALTTDAGASPYDLLGVKFVGWQLDHPIYAPQSLARPLQNRHAVYSNHNHQRFAEAMRLPGRGLSLLAGGEPPAAPPRAHAQRTHAIFIAATFNGEPQALWEQMEASAGKSLLEGVVQRLLADPQVSLLDAFNATSQALDLGAALGADPAFDDQMVSFLREPLTYVRNVDRNRIVAALARSGLPLTLCGWGWRDRLGYLPNVTFIDDHIDFRELTALYNDARIVINLNAGNGACERALYAALAGAAVVSDVSEDLTRQFTPDAEIAIYDRARPDSVVETVRHLIETDGLAEAMAERGRDRALASGLWRHRAEALVAYLQAG